MAYQPVEMLRRLSTIDICTFEAGSGPLLILAHGITANARVWDTVAEPLSAKYHVVALDQRGHGRSGKPAGDCYAAADYAADLKALIDDLDEGPAILVGHSLGGRNVLAAGTLHGNAVRAVVSVEYTPIRVAHDFATVTKRIRMACQPHNNLDAVMENLRTRYPLLPMDALERRLRYGYRQTSDGRMEPLADTEALMTTLKGLQVDNSWALKEIAVPTMVIRGNLGDAITEASAKATKDARPDIPLVLISGTDHFSHEERGPEVAALIENFLNRNVQ